MTEETGKTFTVGCKKIEEFYPREYRLAKLPNGDAVLQGAYYWVQGASHGHEWRDMPTAELGKGMK